MSMHMKLALCALFLAYPVGGAVSQERITSDPDQRQESVGSGHGGMMTDNASGGMMGRGMMRGGMMDRGMMGGRDSHGIMFRMVFALMDGDGDGAISLTEFQAAHDRIFKAMDANKDGRLSADEMQTFMHSRKPTTEQ